MTETQKLFLEGYCTAGILGLAAGFTIAKIWENRQHVATLGTLANLLDRAGAKIERYRERIFHLEAERKIYKARLLKFDYRNQPRDKRGFFVPRKSA